MSTYEFNPITRELDITGTGGSSLSTPISVANGGTASTTQQGALNTLTASSSASHAQVMSAVAGTATFAYPKLPEYVADPSLGSGDVWVLRTDTGGDAGTPVGLLLAVTQTVGASSAYQLSFRTSSGSTVRATLS